MSLTSRRLLALVLAIMAGMAGESLLLIRTEVFKFESILRDDFRVLMFLAKEVPESEQKVIADKLLGLPGVREANFISREAALAALRREDPELMDSLTWMGDNPLHSAFEVRASPDALGSFVEWLAAARSVADWADLRYRPGQVRAILQAQLYGRFLSLMMSALLCLTGAVLAVVLWRTSTPIAPRPAVVILAALGAAVGLILTLAAAWPARRYLPWWELPSFGQQSAAWAAASIIAWLFSPA